MSVSDATDGCHRQGGSSDIGRALAAITLTRLGKVIVGVMECSTYLFSIGEGEVHPARVGRAWTPRLPLGAARVERSPRGGRESGEGRGGKRGTLSIKIL